MFSTLRWTALALVLSLMTAASAPAAPVAPPRPALASPEGEGLLVAAREWLLARLRPAAPPTSGSRRGVPTKCSGTAADPDGRQVSCQ
jgi:hypothetical protein